MANRPFIKSPDYPRTLYKYSNFEAGQIDMITIHTANEEDFLVGWFDSPEKAYLAAEGHEADSLFVKLLLRWELWLLIAIFTIISVA